MSNGSSDPRSTTRLPVDTRMVVRRVARRHRGQSGLIAAVATDTWSPLRAPVTFIADVDVGLRKDARVQWSPGRRARIGFPGIRLVRPRWIAVPSELDVVLKVELRRGRKRYATDLRDLRLKRGEQLVVAAVDRPESRGGPFVEVRPLADF